MKGIVFREFVEMVENSYSPQMMDTLITSVNPESGGAYTSVGTYDHRELVAFVEALSEATGTPQDTLLRHFGHHLGKAFAQKFKSFFDAYPSLFAFLRSVENHIHCEVKKLYPDAELPTFLEDEQQKEASDQLCLHYRSSRPFALVALGLIEVSATYYGEQVSIDMDSKGHKDGTQACFTVRKLS